jgi:dUTP pyrophosphatase
MKLKVLVKRINKNVVLPEITKKGDWVDLRASETIRFKAPQAGVLKSRTIDGQTEKYRNVTFDLQLMPLGVAMKLPDGFEAKVVARSSLPKGFGVTVANSIGVIDGVTTEDTIGYNGNTDEWKTPLLALRDTTITEGERICQFRIQLSQKATIWQKIKWLFTSGIEIVEVDNLPSKINRGGFGTSGKK